jgi:hypothetical protein
MSRREIQAGLINDFLNSRLKIPGFLVWKNKYATQNRNRTVENVFPG